MVYERLNLLVCTIGELSGITGVIGDGNTRGVLNIDELPTMVIGDFIFNTILSNAQGGWEQRFTVKSLIIAPPSLWGSVYCNCHKSQNKMTISVIIWINSNIYGNLHGIKF